MMLLYHFTQSMLVPDILDNGIRPGEYIGRKNAKFKLVSLTSRKDSSRHGLFTGGTVHEGSEAFSKLSPHFEILVAGESPNRFMVLHDQTEAAIEIQVESGDKNLWGLWVFAFLVGAELNHSADLLIAASLASADFPHNDASDNILEARTKYYLPLVNAGLVNNRGWYFYNGEIPATMITNVLTRQADGSYV